MSTTLKRRVVSSLDPSIEHRGGITRCPHCDHDSDDWERTAVVLVTSTVFGKHGSLAVVNECPKCFEKSWIHQPFSFFEALHEMYPKDWMKAADAEHTKRHVAAVSEFADSLCAKCKHLRALECDTLPIVRCTYGVPSATYLHSCFTETECQKFTARK